MSTLSRFSGKKNRDNTFRVIGADYQTPAYAANIAILTKYQCSKTFVQPPALTGPVTFTANVGDGTADDVAPFIPDEMVFLLQSNGVTQTVTFGAGFASTGVLAVTTAKFAYISFVFNGSVWQEVIRTVTA